MTPESSACVNSPHNSEPTLRQTTSPTWLRQAVVRVEQEGLQQALSALQLQHQDGQCSALTWSQCLERLGRVLSSSSPRLALEVYEQLLHLPDVPASAWLVAGFLQDKLGQRQAAAASMTHVIQSPQALPQQVLKAANLLVRLGNQSLALSAATQAFESMGRPVEHAVTLLYIAQMTAHWHWVEELTRQLREAYSADKMSYVNESPRTHLLWCDDEATNLAVLKAWSLQNLPKTFGVPPKARSAQGRRLRVGYLSSDFREHPTARLLLGVLRHHDRRQVELFMYCSGWDDGSKLRQLLHAQFDHVHGVAGLSDAAAAQLIRSHTLDVLVELNGPTRANRMGILAHRPAPVQVGYLGWPGSVGGRVVDYVVADAHTVPPGAEQAYPERVIRLSGTYQSNDHAAWRLPTKPTRAEVGLPADPAIRVLGMFNAINKVHQAVWETWVQILLAVPNSVLWLLSPGDTARAHITQAGHQAGLAPDRLLFAPRLAQGAHLARLQCCDLMLDPWPYGGHTSTADALFAGVPVLALEGNNFAGRVSSGLLRAAGLGDLVADSPQDYVQRAMALLGPPHALDQLRTGLRQQAMCSEVFNAALRARQLEKAFRTAVQRAADGLPPVHIRVDKKRTTPTEPSATSAPSATSSPDGAHHKASVLAETTRHSPKAAQVVPAKDQYRVAIVTPYYRIEPEKLQRCCESVATQTWPCDHFLVADGEPQTLPTGLNLTHVVLPFNVGNTGATPRALGAQLAMVQGYDAVAFLDADNWFDASHIEQAVTAMEAENADVVFARRHLVFADGEVLQANDPQDVMDGHVDTNCYVLSKRVAYLLGLWALYPREFGSGEDRYIKKIMDAHKVRAVRLPEKTVWYETHWGRHYKMANKKPLAPVRKPERTIARNWDEELFAQRTGMRLTGRVREGKTTVQGTADTQAALEGGETG